MKAVKTSYQLASFQNFGGLITGSLQPLNDEFLVIITRNCPSLSKLSISKCNVTDYGVSHCLTLPHLWHINLAFCSKVTNQILTNLIHLGTYSLES